MRPATRHARHALDTDVEPGRPVDPPAGSAAGLGVDPSLAETAEMSAVARPAEPVAHRADRADRAPRADQADDLDAGDDLDDVPEPGRGLGLLLLIGGAVGLVAAFVLVLEDLALLKNPRYIPSCSIDPVLSCGSIMRTAQASLLGFPNPIIGVATFPVVMIAGALVLARVELPRWFWLGLQFGATIGVAFILWLIVQSLAVIHALCPYCMAVWAAMIALFWFVTTYNLSAGHLELGSAGRVLVRARFVVLAVFYLAVIVAVIATFPAYWASKIGLG